MNGDDTKEEPHFSSGWKSALQCAKVHNQLAMAQQALQNLQAKLDSELTMNSILTSELERESAARVTAEQKLQDIAKIFLGTRNLETGEYVITGAMADQILVLLDAHTQNSCQTCRHFVSGSVPCGPSHGLCHRFSVECLTDSSWLCGKWESK